MEAGQNYELEGHEGERNFKGLLHAVKDDLSLAKLSSYGVSVQNGVLVAANVSLGECVHLFHIIVTLTSLNLNQREHIEKATTDGESGEPGHQDLNGALVIDFEAVEEEGNKDHEDHHD